MEVMNHKPAEREAELMQANREELVERIARAMREDGTLQPLKGLHLYRYSLPLELGHGMAEPSVCVIAQGSKEVLLGDSRYRYDPSQYLLATVELPTIRRVLEASKERPFILASGDRAICLKRCERFLPMSLRFWEPLESSRNVKRRIAHPLGLCRRAAWNMKGRFMTPTLRGFGHNVIATGSPLRRLKRSDLSFLPTCQVSLNASPRSVDVSPSSAFLALFISLRNPWAGAPWPGEPGASDQLARFWATGYDSHLCAGDLESQCTGGAACAGRIADHPQSKPRGGAC
jgi:AraC-type transcriptional regulator N-terminus